jgi:hypothetical protein
MTPRQDDNWRFRINVTDVMRREGEADIDLSSEKDLGRLELRLARILDVSHFGESLKLEKLLRDVMWRDARRPPFPLPYFELRRLGR